MMPKVGLIVLTYNGLELTRACLDSIRASDYPNLETWVVDNASVDDTLQTVRQAYPEVQLLALPENRGYAGGNNAGIQAALAHGAELVFLVNNDTALYPDCISSLVRALRRHPQAGMAGPMVHTWDDNLISSAGGQAAWRHADAVNVGMGEADTGQYAERQVDFINGCSLMVTRAAIASAGLLDERFFMYWEEVDWAMRFRAAGWEIWFEPEARIRHRAPIHWQGQRPTTLYYVTRNRLSFMLRYAPWPGKPLAVARALWGAWRGIRGHQQAGRLVHARATQLAIRHALQRRWGRIDWVPGPPP